MRVQKLQNLSLTLFYYLFVSRQMTILEFHNKWLLFLGHPLPQLSDHIFEILQDLTVAEIKW